MKSIVSLLMLMAVIAPGYTQLRCFQCNPCTQPFDFDLNHLEVCTVQTTAAPPPGAPVLFNDPTLTPPPNGTPTTTTGATTVAPTDPTAAPTDPTAAPTSPTPPGDPIITTANTTTPTTTTPSGIIVNPWHPSLRCFRVEQAAVGETAASVRRGCVSWITNSQLTCSRIPGATNENCMICNTNECNAGTKMITSFGTIIATLLIVIKFY